MPYKVSFLQVDGISLSGKLGTLTNLEILDFATVTSTIGLQRLIRYGLVPGIGIQKR
jgi:hypothetical protein